MQRLLPRQPARHNPSASRAMASGAASSSSCGCCGSSSDARIVAKRERDPICDVCGHNHVQGVKCQICGHVGKYIGECHYAHAMHVRYPPLTCCQMHSSWRSEPAHSRRHPTGPAGPAGSAQPLPTASGGLDSSRIPDGASAPLLPKLMHGTQRGVHEQHRTLSTPSFSLLTRRRARTGFEDFLRHASTSRDAGVANTAAAASRARQP